MTPKFSQNRSKNVRKAAMQRGLPCCGAGLHGPMNTPPHNFSILRRGDASASHISRTSHNIQILLPFRPPSAAGLRRKILEFPANSGTRSAQRRRNPKARGLVDFQIKKSAPCGCTTRIKYSVQISSGCWQAQSTFLNVSKRNPFRVLSFTS